MLKINPSSVEENASVGASDSALVPPPSDIPAVGSNSQDKDTPVSLFLDLPPTQCTPSSDRADKVWRSRCVRCFEWNPYVCAILRSVYLFQ